MQAHLRRAVSTAYYALFHCLARCCADTLVTFFKSEVQDRIEDARTTVRNFEAADMRHRRAFAVHVLFRERH